MEQLTRVNTVCPFINVTYIFPTVAVKTTVPDVKKNTVAVMETRTVLAAKKFVVIATRSGGQNQTSVVKLNITKMLYLSRKPRDKKRSIY